MLRYCTKSHRQMYTLNKLMGNKRVFSTNSTQQEGGLSVDLGTLQRQAQAIQESIDSAKMRIKQNTQKGLDLSRQIASQVEEDKFTKMQRYQIFISKMEQLQRAENKQMNVERKAALKMQSAFMNSQHPLKDVLYYYQKASVKGFDASLVYNTLVQINRTIQARGNKPRVYDDYATHELDQSWRMQQLAEHIKRALEDDQYFNHYFLGQTSLQLGEIGYKDCELIEKYFRKIHKLLDYRAGKETNAAAKTLDFEQSVYGSFLNFVPRHYVYEGFESNQEFAQHLRTLLDWQVDKKDGLKELGVEDSRDVNDLELAMARVINASNTVQDVSKDFQASIDSLRQQYFKLMEAQDKHAFMKENKYIYFDLLELQSLLVQGGYLNPEEAEQFNASQPHEVRMERAAQVFYDYVQNYAPELMSPQYQAISEAVQDSLDARQERKREISLDEQHDKISLGSLSKSLIGLSKQALSFRREAHDKDYLHKFYEDHARQNEIRDQNHPMFELSHLTERQTVSMERDYLRAWNIFENEVRSIWPKMEALIMQSRNDLDGQLHCLAAMSACKIDKPEIRSMLLDNINHILKDKDPRQQSNASVNALINGINGIAMQSSVNKHDFDIAQKLMDRLAIECMSKNIHLTFDQKLNVLWSDCAIGNENKSLLVRQIFHDICEMNFERTDNDLTYAQYEKVKDVFIYITRVSKLKDSDWVQKEMNSSLQQIIENPQYHEMRYQESAANYDPFKKRVLEGLSRGLTMASIDHSSSMQENMYHQQIQEMRFNSQNYPYNVDLILGHMGSKVLLNVIPATQTMWDTQSPDGSVRFRQKILKGLNAGSNVETVAIPITSVIKYDIANLKLDLNTSYNFLRDIEKQIGKSGKGLHIDFNLLSTFGVGFTKDASNYVSKIESVGDKRRMEGFFKQLYKIFQIKQQTEKQHEKEIYQEGLDSLKFELMKLSLLYDGMPTHQRSYIDGFCKGSNFKDMLINQKDNVSGRVVAESANSQVDLKWQGTRLEVELPQQAHQVKKNIVPEIINQKFMWVDDYFHYKDWEQQLRDVFDSFNLLVIPRKQGDFKYFYDRCNNQRITPQGIFPPPNKKREILMPQAQEFVEVTKGSDELNVFEKDPYQLMVSKELKRSEKLKPLTPEISYMTNLQNIKQGLKQDYTDKQIMDLILVNLSFTDKLIEQHLDASKSQSNEKAQFIARDASNYRDFIRSSYFSKDQEDPFSHFYILESGKVERVYKAWNDANNSQAKDIYKNHPDQATAQKARKVLQTLSSKIDDMLIENHNENTDTLSLSHHLGHEVSVNYNLRSLMKSEYVYDVDPELIDPDVSDEMFLLQQRKRAESKLIKTKIIYKIDQGHELTENEKKYLSQWTNQLQSGKDVNLHNHRDTMLPDLATSMTLKDISAEDMFALNQVPNVQLSRKDHGNFAVNDLVLELSHFLDEDVVNRVELQLMSNRLKKQWGLPEHFQIIETRNKEISIALNELEEVAWRMAGTFNQKDIATLESMFSIQRNQDYFDQQYYNQDMLSMKEFIKTANYFDDRQKLLEEWVVRKEQEIKERVNLPPKQFQKSDSELFAINDAKLRKAREQLVSKFLMIDEFGNKAPQKAYGDLTTAELAQIAESISVRLHLFKGDYPAFMPQAVKAVMEHPNLSQSDAQKLTSFCQMFELDWRGDRDIANKREYLSTNPIYLGERDKSNFKGYGEIGNFEVTAMLRHACAPFVEEVATKMQNYSRK